MDLIEKVNGTKITLIFIRLTYFLYSILEKIPLAIFGFYLLDPTWFNKAILKLVGVIFQKKIIPGRKRNHLPWNNFDLQV